MSYGKTEGGGGHLERERITARVPYGKARETTAALSYEGTGENYN